MGILRQLILLTLFVGCGLVIPIAYVWITQSSALTIHHISVKSGHQAKPEELQVYLREFVGKPLYGVDLKHVQAVALRHPWAAQVAVRREPPHELVVEVTEREPVALIKKEHLWVVDSRGVAFKVAQSEKELALPMLFEPKSVVVLLTHKQANRPGGNIVEVQKLSEGQSRVLFSGGLEVIIGVKQSLGQWEKLAQVLKSLKGKADNLAFVYLDGDSKLNQIPIRFKKG
ncbi:MAG: FtsQ-type POTRA domain-containing protein [Deltaproteobacteria bacterium]|nr:FtsQ-type POTRA domain-containing protein [Deltaproteobacteria bacterium]